LQGSAVKIEKIVIVDVKPGWKAGTKITYQGTADFPKSITLILQEEKHPFLERIG